MNRRTFLAALAAIPAGAALAKMLPEPAVGSWSQLPLVLDLGPDYQLHYATGEVYPIYDRGTGRPTGELLARFAWETSPGVYMFETVDIPKKAFVEDDRVRAFRMGVFEDGSPSYLFMAQRLKGIRTWSCVGKDSWVLLNA